MKHYLLKQNASFWGKNHNKRHKYANEYLIGTTNNIDTININKLYLQIRAILKYTEETSTRFCSILMITNIKQTVAYSRQLLLRKKWTPGAISNFKLNPYTAKSAIRTLPGITVIINNNVQKDATNECFKYKIAILKTQNSDNNPELSSYPLITNNENQRMQRLLTQTLLKHSISSQLEIITKNFSKTKFISQIYKTKHTH